MERSYSVSEIDTMRQYVEQLLTREYGITISANGTGWSNDSPKVADREEVLRTYMSAGVDPNDLGIAVEKKRTEFNRHIQSMKAMRAT